METRIDTVAKIIDEYVWCGHNKRGLNGMNDAADEIFKLFYGDVEEFRDREEKLKKILREIIEDALTEAEANIESREGYGKVTWISLNKAQKLLEEINDEK